MKRKYTGLVFFISLLLFCCSCNTLESKTRVEGFTYIKKVFKGKDVKGNNITVEYFKNKKSTLEITTTPFVKIKGKVVVVGNAPFTQLTVQTGKTVYYLKPEFHKKYWQKQEKVVELRGRLEKRILKNKATGKVLKRNWFYPE